MGPRKGSSIKIKHGQGGGMLLRYRIWTGIVKRDVFP